MKTFTLGFLGGGRITRIFLQAFAGRKREFSSVMVYDISPEATAILKSQFPYVIVADSPEQVAGQSVIMIALHPPVIMEMLENIALKVKEDALVISLAPKITLEKIASKLKTGNLVRMIPNATSYLNDGYNPVTFSRNFPAEMKGRVLGFLKELGVTFETEENNLEAFAILSAMLPTYFWFQWKELISLGGPLGLTEDDSKEAVKNTLLAAIRLYFDSGLTPAQVMDLIPVRPIGENQQQIEEIYRTRLLGLYEKIKPV